MAKEAVERELRARQADLIALVQHPSWPLLREIFNARKKAQLSDLANSLISGDEVDQRKIDRIAGFWIGANWVLSNPELAERSLKQALAHVERMTEEGSNGI